MPQRGNNGDADRWSDIRPHEEFLELCAVSTTGALSEEERKRLRDHLALCAECRQALKEFESVADVGVPLLASELSGGASDEPRAGTDGAAQTAFADAPAPPDAVLHESAAFEEKKELIFAHRNGHRGSHLNWNYVWMPFAAAVLLTVALGVSGT
jgi:hypothetical protein